MATSGPGSPRSFRTSTGASRSSRATRSFEGKPIIIGESDPDGCAACPSTVYPQNGYRNGTLYASYTAASFARKYSLAEKHGVNFEGAVTWAFEFEDQPYFAGFRVLSTNGIPLPVLNVFRMFGLMGGQRLAVESTGEVGPGGDSQGRRAGQAGRVGPGEPAGRQGLRPGLAPPRRRRARAGGRGRVDAEPASRTGEPVLLEHFRIDRDHSNAFEAWKRMGSPARPTPEQYGELERSSDLALLGSPEWVRPADGKLTVRFALPRQAVSLLVLDRAGRSK